MHKQAKNLESRHSNTPENFKNECSELENGLDSLYEERDLIAFKDQRGIYSNEEIFKHDLYTNRGLIKDCECKYTNLICSCNDYDYNIWLVRIESELLEEAIKMKDDVLERKKIRKENGEPREDVPFLDTCNKNKLISKLALYKEIKQAREDNSF